MYRLYYNRKTNGDILFLLFEPESYPDKVEEKGEVIALWKGETLVGINFLNISKKIKIRANGMIATPDDKLIDILNYILENSSLPKLPYCRDSFFRKALVTKVDEHPLNEALSILILSLGEEKAITATRFQNIKAGDRIVIALDGCLRYDGSVFHKRVERNIPIDVEVCSELTLGLGENDKEALLLEEGEAGQDFFLG